MQELIHKIALSPTLQVRWGIWLVVLITLVILSLVLIVKNYRALRRRVDRSH
jgi:putative copper export protein